MGSQPLLFFDCSASTGRWAASHTGCFFEAGELLQYMDHYGIGQSLVWHALARAASPRVGNPLLIEALQGHSRLHPVWGLLPEFFETAESRRALLRSLQDHGVRAVRIFPGRGHHHFSTRTWVAGAMLETLQERRIPLFIERDEIGWNEWAELLSTWPDLPVILVNTSYRNERHLFALLEQHPRFHLEISTFVGHRRLEAAVRRFGASRFLFGTQMPVWDPGAVLSVLAYSDIAEEERRQIAGTNLVRLLEGVRHD